uniref:Uncharacterized protein n=1 Tax=Coccidioides posadasii RMSCC 3488 TaxID=454284 RepID=A0A0J6F056_COCPO|nr:hypothetical protein CPAG_02591 [Coccidioides posadasii RMSCC 3488]
MALSMVEALDHLDERPQIFNKKNHRGKAAGTENILPVHNLKVLSLASLDDDYNNSWLQGTAAPGVCRRLCGQPMRSKRTSLASAASRRKTMSKGKAHRDSPLKRLLPRTERQCFETKIASPHGSSIHRLELLEY